MYIKILVIILSVLIMSSLVNALACGTYINTATFTVNSNMTCVGVQDALIVNRSNVVINCSSPTPNIIISGGQGADSQGIQNQNYDNITVHNCDIRLFETNVDFVGCGNCTLRDNIFIGGVSATNIFLQTSNYYNLLRNHYINIGASSVALTVLTSSYGNQTDETVLAVAVTGVASFNYVLSVGNIIKDNNLISMGGSVGLQLAGSNTFIINNNNLSCAGCTTLTLAPFFASPINNVVTNNNIIDSGLSGMITNSARYLILTNNTIKTSNGILQAMKMQDSDNVNMTNNTIINTGAGGGGGAFIYGGTGNLISSYNIIEGDNFGLSLDNSINNSFINDTYDARTTGALILKNGANYNNFTNITSSAFNTACSLDSVKGNIFNNILCGSIGNGMVMNNANDTIFKDSIFSAVLNNLVINYPSTNNNFTNLTVRGNTNINLYHEANKFYWGIG